MNNLSVFRTIFLLCVLSAGCGEQNPSVITSQKLEFPAEEKVPSPQERAQLNLMQQKPASQPEVKNEQKTEAEEPAGRINPFLSLDEEEYFSSTQGRLMLNNAEVTAIFYSPPDSKAIINGYVVKKNDMFEGKEVLEINPEDVVLKDAQGEYIVRMRNIN
ncbi:MAG: hypothetical protein PHE58_06955 [Candidatus Omnitrophica bacterium]|nr:hypothetical protein [Candidatus Omnitrophota bacterium]